MKRRKIGKVGRLFLIYVYEHFKGNKVKIFNAITTNYQDFDWKFSSHTPEENEKFLLDWKRKNHIRLSDYVFKSGIGEDGVPYFINKKD